MQLSDLTYAYVGDVVKSERDANGDLVVYGKATGPDLDLDGQRCQPAWLRKAMPEWARWGNLREQHGAIAAGVGLELTEQGDDWYLKALVVDPGTARKVERGVLKGYSIGIKGATLVKTAAAPNGMISNGQVVEVSLVDRPSNPTCEIGIAKSAGLDMLVPVNGEGSSLVHDGDTVTVDKGEVFLTESATVTDVDAGTSVVVKTPKPSPLDMPGAVKTADVDKATDVDRLDAPDHSQKCADCGEDGHLHCKAVNLGGDGDGSNLDGAGGGAFDRDAAVALVKATLNKAADEDESGDISGAQSAIAILAELIGVEASHLSGKPAEQIDIRLLLDAVSALTMFIAREQAEATGDGSPMFFAATPDVGKKSKYDTADMERMLKDGKAMANPDGDPSYPIADAEDLSNAIKAVGRGKGDHGAIRKHIIKRAKALGKADMLPDDWADKAATPDEVKGRSVSVTIDGERYDFSGPAEAVEAVAKAVSPAAKETEDDGHGHDPKTCDIKNCKACAAAANKGESGSHTAADEGYKAAEPDLVKALTGVLKDEDSELRELFKSLLGGAETAKALTDIGARLAQVEQMATPGGPALRRTEGEVRKSRNADLLIEADRYKRLSDAAEDADLRRGYLSKAAALTAQAKTLH